MYAGVARKARSRRQDDACSTPKSRNIFFYGRQMYSAQKARQCDRVFLVTSYKLCDAATLASSVGNDSVASRLPSC